MGGQLLVQSDLSGVSGNFNLPRGFEEQELSGR